jgi:aspartate kinase
VVIRGISLDRKQAKLTVAGVPEKPGAAGRIFSIIAAHHIIVDMIVQSAAIEGKIDISFTIHEDELEDARKVLMPVVSEIQASRLNTTSGSAKLSVVGIGMRSHAGVAARFFECIGKAGINIQLVSTSEIKIAVLMDGSQADQAAQMIHAEFGLARLAPTLAATRPLG